jgi:DNA-binding NarL/FixJ family response regulator
MSARAMIGNRMMSSREDAVRILIASDRKLVRLGVRAILSDNPLWHICGEAKRGREVIAKLGELTPVLVVLDLRISKLEELEFVSKIHQSAPAAKIVALTSSECSQLEFAARKAGADVVIAKRMLSNKLLNMLQWQFSSISCNLHTLIQASLHRIEGFAD